MALMKSVSKALYLFCSGPGGGRGLALSARVLVRRSNFHLVFTLIGMILLRSCPFYSVSMFRPGPLQCSGISAERIMRPSTLVDYCIPGGVVPLSGFGRMKPLNDKLSW